MSLVEVKVPDIGDFSDVPVIDLFVKVGDAIKVDDAIATLESDKATMDVPSPVAGVVKEVLVQLGAKVAEGSLLIKVEAGAVNAENAPKSESTAAAAPAAPVVAPVAASHAGGADLEQFRVQMNKELEKSGVKVSMLPFMMKAAVATLKKFPEFNASLDGDALVMKNYWHIGFAADTPNGLVVPVIKNADKKSVFEIAQESGDLAKQARDGKLKPADMQGACFTISSLGGIGGTYFAPIVNAPEVAILGVNKSAMKPVWDGKQFVPRLTLPLSLTADHRVIDGALATRFNVYVAELLADMRRMIV